MHKVSITKFIKKKLQEFATVEPPQNATLLYASVKEFFKNLRMRGDLYIAMTPEGSTKQMARLIDVGYAGGRWVMYVQLPSVIDLKYMTRMAANVKQDEKFDDQLQFTKYDVSVQEE